MSGYRLSLAFVVLFACRASAHDFWIEPSTFRPTLGERVTAALRVGEKLRGEPVPRVSKRLDRFILVGSAGERALSGSDGDDPSGYALIAESGLHWIGYQSNPSPVVLEAGKFEDYLREEGLEQIIAERAKRGLSADAGRERFYRCAKSLLQTAGTSPRARIFDTALGFTLELVPRRSPYLLRPGGELPISLLFRGKPVANALVVAMNKDEPEKSVKGRTDAKGRVTLRLAQSGFWLIKAVHMASAPPDAGVDWESWWASMTFELTDDTRQQR